jgi:hypothetical protein
MADNDKILVRVKGNPSVKVTDDQTIVRDIKVGTPIRNVIQSKYHASSIGGPNLDNSMLRESDGVLVLYTDLLPDSTLTRSLGSPDKKFHSVYVGGGTIYLGGLSISEDSFGHLILSGVDSAGIIIPESQSIIATNIDSDKVLDIVVPVLDSAIAKVVGLAPEHLDTLQELAEALNNDSTAYQSLVDMINNTVDSAGIADIIDTQVDSAYVVGKVAGLINPIASDAYTITPSVIDTFNSAEYRTVKYLIQLENDLANKYHASEILLTHNGSEAFITEYAIVTTDSSLGEFDAIVENGSIILSVTPEYTGTYFRARRINIDA